MFVSLYLKKSLNHTLKELNEAELYLFGILFQVLAPWYPKDVLQYSRRRREISKSSIFLVLYLLCVINKLKIAKICWAVLVSPFKLCVINKDFR